jgi:hypothetical protein
MPDSDNPADERAKIYRDSRKSQEGRPARIARQAFARHCTRARARARANVKIEPAIQILPFGLPRRAPAAFSIFTERPRSESEAEGVGEGARGGRGGARVTNIRCVSPRDSIRLG